MAKITGLGKIIVGCVCVGIWVNGFINAATWVEAGASAIFFLGGAGVAFYWAHRDRKKAKAQATATAD